MTTTIPPLPDFFPDYMRTGVIEWIDRGLPQGGFLTAFFEGRLFDAVCSADSSNFEVLAQCARWIAQNAPGGCYGSPEKCQAWQARGGRGGK